MKAFTSFSSKPILHNKLGSLSPSVAFRFSDKPFSSFILPFRNYQKGSIFCLLKLVQNKGIFPFHAVPSEHQEVDLETVEPQVQQSEQTNESNFVRVEFQLQKDCDFGEQFLIVGDDPMLGSWNPLEALPMTWSDGHLWTLELDIPAGKPIQYKFILKGIEGDIIWQPGLDRIIHTWETMNRIIVCEDWENAELQKIIEDRFFQPNEELQILSEVSTSTEISDNSRIHEEEKPIVEPVMQQNSDDSTSSTEKPMAIIAENIGSSEDLMESTTHETYKRNAVQKSEESAASLNNPEGTTVEGSLFDFEGGPVLVPGLIPPTEEGAGSGEVEEEEEKTAIAIDPSIEPFETQVQNIPEFSKDEESEDGTQQEITTTINDELISYEEHFHLAPTMEQGSNSQPIHGNALQNDIDWGRETVKKFLTKFGLL